MSDNKDSLFSMSLDDGRIVFRNAQVDRQVNYYPVPYAVVTAIRNREVDWKTVKSACEAKMKEKGDLNIQDYLQKLKLLNVRRTRIDLSEDKPKVEDRSDEMVSLADILPSKKMPPAAPDKKTPTSDRPQQRMDIKL